MHCNLIMPVYPISFSIPAMKIVSTIPPKTRLLAHIIPGDMRTYIYKNETDYYQGYRESWFALTCKKAGWDCMRHYEIIANGCIPLFLDLDQCPKNTMTTFPKELIVQSNQLYFKIMDEGLNPKYEQQCVNIINQLLHIAREHMTCEATAKYILNTISESARREQSSLTQSGNDVSLTQSGNDVSLNRSILYLSGHMDPDYLRCLTLIGFKQLMGAKCHDYPRVQHIYTDCVLNDNMWGKGITYAYNVNTELRDASKDDTIIEDIVARKYDLIIYGSGHRGLPYIDLVQAHYSANKIVILCGEDCDRDIKYAKHCCLFSNANAHVFIREQI